MKAQILNTDGKKIKEINTKLFEEPIRKDIISKVVEAEKIRQAYAPKLYAGMNRSASGLASKRRHVWKSDRGKGLSRIPRKVMWRRGTQFNWVGAIVPSTKGGRRAHPPKGLFPVRKINKKEYIKALLSSLTCTNSAEELKKKYTSFSGRNINLALPLIVEKKILLLNTKQFFESLDKILGELSEIAIPQKSKRAGIGKMRGRKYKKNAGLLFVIGKDEKKSMKGIDIVNSDNLMVSDLASNGARLTLFTEKAVEELEKISSSQGENKNMESIK